MNLRFSSSSHISDICGFGLKQYCIIRICVTVIKRYRYAASKPKSSHSRVKQIFICLYRIGYPANNAFSSTVIIKFNSYKA